MDESKKAEAKIAKLYAKLQGTAKEFGYEFQLPAVTPGSLPTVMFIGNHSSGKSTYINYLLGGEPAQMTGVAPTDDCFTVLKYGKDERDIKGPAAIMELGPEFARLEKLGPSFLERLQVKYRDRDILAKAVLIDSPGMLDAAAKREYDFARALDIFSETAAMVVVMFDPEKPGTTGETIDALKGPLAGRISKLHILMNKCDTLANVFDFCRAYGTLCWNLARVLRVKDIPLVHVGRVPVPGAKVSQGIDIAFLDSARRDLDDVIRDSGTLRSSTMLASARHDFTRLAMQMKVIKSVSRSIFSAQAAAFVFTTLFGLLAASRFVAIPAAGGGSILEWCGVSAAVAVTLFAAFLVTKAARSIARKIAAASIDSRFAELYRAETAADGERCDLDQYWSQVKPAVMRQFDRGWRQMPLFGLFTESRVQSALDALK